MITSRPMTTKAPDVVLRGGDEGRSGIFSISRCGTSSVCAGIADIDSSARPVDSGTVGRQRGAEGAGVHEGSTGGTSLAASADAIGAEPESSGDASIDSGDGDSSVPHL